MIKNYLKIAWRNLVRYKLYSTINILGLAIGLSVCMLIMLYVVHESTYDRFHSKASRIFKVQEESKLGGESQTTPFMSYATAPLMKQQEPTIKSFIRIKEQWNSIVLQNPLFPSRKFSASDFLFADNNFFSFFSFSLVKGDAQTVLKNPYTVVISVVTAEKYFGRENPIGKVLRYNNKYNFLVTGVAANAPSNSSINFDFVASLSSLSTMDEEKNLVSGPPIVQAGAFFTYFLMNHPADALRLDAAIQQMADAAAKNNSSSYRSIPIVKDHLQENSRDFSNTKYLSLFSWIAVLILLLALSNYISLATSRSSVRAKEIGVRKAMGADRKSIAGQFFLESAFCVGIAFCLAYIFCTQCQTWFFHFLNITIDSNFLYTPVMIGAYLLLFGLTILLSGAYPAILLSAYKPTLTLYGKLSNKTGSVSLRRFVTVFQFIISVTLILSGIVIQQQLDFFRNSDTGFNRENIVMIPFGSSIGSHYASFKKEISTISGINGAATAHYAMFKGTDGLYTKTIDGEKEITLPMMNVDENFIPLLGIQWKIRPTDTFYASRKYIAAINQEAIAKLHLPANPVGKTFQVGDQQIEIGGVIKDFNYASLHNKIDALCLFIAHDTAAMWGEIGGNLFAKIQPHTNIPTALIRIQRIYEKYDQQKPFEYTFMDEAFNAMYAAENKLAKLFTAFTIISLFIGSLGLFGLATFTAEQRTREIGIRKVLGASVQSIVTLLSKDVIKLVLLSIVISSPLAWWLMNKWLENFAYRINISWLVFVITGISVIAIALLSVCFQAFKVAISNPAKSLRTE